MGIAWAKKESSFALSHVQLFKPFLQVLLFLGSLLQNTVALQKRGKRAMASATFRLVWNHPQCLYILSRLSSLAAFFSWDILYIAFFFSTTTFSWGHSSYQDFFPNLFYAFSSFNLLALKLRPCIGDNLNFQSCAFLLYDFAFTFLMKCCLFPWCFGPRSLCFRWFQSCFLFFFSCSRYSAGPAVLQYSYTSVGNILHSRVQFHKEKSKKRRKVASSILLQ